MKIKNLKNSLMEKIKNRRFKMASLSVFTILTLFLGQFFITASAQAADPQFNTFTPFVHTQTYNRDYYLLDAKNDTQGTSWGFPVSANAGDLLTFYFYYHNTTNNSEATNTTLRVAMPSGQSTSQNVVAYLWADNATNASAASPLSQSLPVNLTSSQTLDYVAGSAKWYPKQADWRTAAATAFPNSQSGERLFSSGINVGSVQGCWEYSSAVIFQARVGNTTTGTGNLSINKTVRNVTDGQYSYSDSVNVKSNDYVMWQIQSQNTGNTTLNNVTVSDSLPSYMSYVSGTTLVDGSYQSNSITSGGLNLGSLSSGATKTITFQTQMNSSLSNSQTLTNYAYASADSVGQRSDTASVYSNQGTVPVYTTFSKKVENLTSPNGSNTDDTASVGDTLRYTLTYTNNSGISLFNAQILDVLPSYTTYYSTDSNGYYNSTTNMITWNVGLVSPGSTVTVSHQVKVQNVPSTNYLIANTAAVKADNLSLINSNEVRTTVAAIVPAVKGVSVAAVTGGDNVARSLAVSLMVSLWCIFFMYLIIENQEFWQKTKVKWAVFKIKMKER